jgi:hypothetical protein
MKYIDKANIEKVIHVLKNLQLNLITEEFTLQDIIAQQLEEAQIPYIKEYKLAPRNRIDFLLIWHHPHFLHLVTW